MLRKRGRIYITRPEPAVDGLLLPLTETGRPRRSAAPIFGELSRTSHERTYYAGGRDSPVVLAAESDMPMSPRHRHDPDREYGGDDGYSYTDPATMYRDTEPAWGRPRAGSLDRRGQQPSSFLLDQPLRRPVREPGPPPSTRGFDKINTSIPRRVHGRSSTSDRSDQLPEYDLNSHGSPSRTSSTRSRSPLVNVQDALHSHQRSNQEDTALGEIQDDSRDRGRNSSQTSSPISTDSPEIFPTPPPFDDQSVSSHVYRIDDSRREHWVNAYVNDIRVQVFPDSGSALNLISEAYVRKHNMEITDGTTELIQLPNGRTTKSSGSLNALFRFEDEHKASRINFTILAGCIHDFVLSGPFLNATQTFTKLKHRIHHSPLLRPTAQVCFHGIPRQRITGSINGRHVFASVDTGSDVNLILESHAIALGLEVFQDINQTILEFIDGTEVEACGILPNVTWQFGASKKLEEVEVVADSMSPAPVSYGWEYGSNASQHDTFMCDFYVLRDLTVPVILSSTMLYGTNAFNACDQYIMQLSNAVISAQEIGAEVAVVAKRWPFSSKKLPRKDEPAPSSGTNSTSVSQGHLTSDEECRRILIEEERISRLAQCEQATARAEEQIQRQKWIDAQASINS